MGNYTTIVIDFETTGLSPGYPREITVSQPKSDHIGNRCCYRTPGTAKLSGNLLPGQLLCPCSNGDSKSSGEPLLASSPRHQFNMDAATL